MGEGNAVMKHDFIESKTDNYFGSCSCGYFTKDVAHTEHAIHADKERVKAAVQHLKEIGKIVLDGIRAVHNHRKESRMLNVTEVEAVLAYVDSLEGQTR